LIEIDEFDSWLTDFENHLEPVLTETTIKRLADAQFKFIDDPGRLVANAIGKPKLAEALRQWLLDRTIKVFHATRLLPSELESLSQNGLVPLEVSARRNRLEELLSKHPEWDDKKFKFNWLLNEEKKGTTFGNRSGQVHFSLSKATNQSVLPHYLEFGSEFDQRIASTLFPDGSWKELFKINTQPHIVHVGLNGAELICGCCPFHSFQDQIERGDLPEPARIFVNLWAAKKAELLETADEFDKDVCLIFETAFQGDRILQIEISPNK